MLNSMWFKGILDIKGPSTIHTLLKILLILSMLKNVTTKFNLMILIIHSSMIRNMVCHLVQFSSNCFVVVFVVTFGHLSDQCVAKGNHNLAAKGRKEHSKDNYDDFLHFFPNVLRS